MTQNIFDVGAFSLVKVFFIMILIFLCFFIIDPILKKSSNVLDRISHSSFLIVAFIQFVYILFMKYLGISYRQAQVSLILYNINTAHSYHLVHSNKLYLQV